MDSIAFKKEVVFLYTKFKRHYDNSPGYVYRYDERTSTLLNNFIALLQERYEMESLGSKFLVDFFHFHFSFWNRPDPKLSRIPYLNWCVGEKGLSRWTNRSNNWRYFANKNIGKIPDDITFSINTTGSSTKKVDKKAAKNRFYANFKEGHFTEINKFEEDDKERFHNTIEGFLNCREFTTLYNRKSKNCIKCKYAKKCREELLIIFPEIARTRGYEKIER